MKKATVRSQRAKGAKVMLPSKRSGKNVYKRSMRRK